MADYLGVFVAMLMCAVSTGLGMPLARKKIGPNGWYGYRIPATMRDERIWYEVNARGGRHMVFAGVGSGIVALVALLFWGNEAIQSTLAFVAMGLVLATMLVSTVIAVRMAGRMSESVAEKPSGRGEPPNK